MINRLIVATIAALLGGTSIAAAANPVVWSGSVIIQAATPKANCDAVNVQVNEMHTGVLHPKLAGDVTVPTDVLQILQAQNATRITPAGAGVTHFAASGNYNATFWNGRAIIKTFSSTYNSFVVSPATILSTTPFVTIRGTVLNFGGPASGCTVTFAGAFVRKP
jgi:hypothetical protein